MVRDLACQCLSILTDEGGLLAGIYQYRSTEYVVLVTVLSSQPLLSVFVSDKVTEFLCNRPSVLEQINSLNRDELQGTHQIYEFVSGVIYAYKQTRPLKEDFSCKDLCDMIEDGIREFQNGLQLLRRCL